MKITVRTKVLYNNTPSIVKTMHSNAGNMAYDYARRVMTEARVRAPYDTGFLRSSIVTKKVAHGRHNVEVGAPYGAFVEYGHHVRTKTGARMVPAQPFFRPAVESVRRNFRLDAKRIVHR